MSNSPVPRVSIKTERLVLRPTIGLDADRAFEIQTDWAVTRMLRAATFPPDRHQIGRWFADHRREWRDGEAYRFAAELDGRMIGIVDIDEITAGKGTLGYWFDHATWARGFAFEAAQVITRFAFESADLQNLESGHASDNPASGRILTKLGFDYRDTVERFSRPRGETIMQHRYVRTRQSGDR